MVTLIKSDGRIKDSDRNRNVGESAKLFLNVGFYPDDITEKLKGTQKIKM